MNKPNKYKPTAPVPHASSSKEALLEAALKAFARYGFEGASLHNISRMAEVAPPLIHYYFGSKDNLWRETVDYSLGELRREAAAIQNATRTLAPLDRLRVLLQAITHFAARCPDHFSMIIAEARSESGRYAWVHEHYTGVLFENVVSILKDARDQGTIKDVDMEQLAFFLIGGILLYFTASPIAAKDKNIHQTADKYTDHLFEIFLEGVSVKKAAS